MRLLVGTSGFSYREWRGSFYPAELREPDMLESYAARLDTVEINNTFYRMPQPALLAGWQSKVPATFCFALKAPRSLTHIARLKEAGALLQRFFGAATTLGPRLGPILFQLPPFLRKDAGVLREFLALLPARGRAAFEFRHPSWFDAEVEQLLADAGAALVSGDPDEGDALPLVPTAKFGYVRLRAPGYDVAALAAWQQRIEKQPWDEAYVYLKHEVLGPAYALGLAELWQGRAPLLPPRSAESEAATRTTDARPRRRKSRAAELEAALPKPLARARPRPVKAAAPQGAAAQAENGAPSRASKARTKGAARRSS
jgi:uncharacterized protein YecE (DUF72 family)